MKLHIHFGVHRTGTTSIHKALSGSVGILRSHGVLYPNLGVNHRHVKLAWQLKSGKVAPEEVVRRIRAECNDLTQQVILTSEDFCLIDIETWLALLSKHFDVTASVYIKRQDRWLESWYNQHIKWPWASKFSSATPEFFIENMKDFYWIDYKKLLGRITSVVPRDKLYVNVAGEGGVKDTVSDFLSHVGIDQRWLNSYQDGNASLTSARLDIVRRLDLYRLPPEARKRILSVLDEVDVQEDDGRKDIFTNPQMQYVLDKFEKANREVARTYFEREELFDKSDLGKKRRAPAFVTDERAYRIYIPEMLKRLSQGQG